MKQDFLNQYFRSSKEGTFAIDVS